MSRIKRGVLAHKKKKKLFKLAKGFRGSNKKLLRIARGAVEKSLKYAYRDRRQKKRDFRALWIMRINAQARQNDITYSQLIAGLHKSNIMTDRKILADLALTDEKAFALLANKAKDSLVASKAVAS